jgi:hypothetical protein
VIKTDSFAIITTTSIIILMIFSGFPASGIANNKIITTPSNQIIEKTDEFITTYDFKEITSPSTTHKAGYKTLMMSLNNQPPEDGPQIPSLKEFNNAAYTRLSLSDNNPATTTTSRGKQLHHFQFTIEENISTIKSLNIHWEGHTKKTHTNLYIWDHQHQMWELIGTNRFMRISGIISKTYINSISDYINETSKQLYIIAISQTPNLLNQHLNTEYIKIKVGNPTTVSLQDDAYHYNNQSVFVEWWFINVYNETRDKQFFISYHIFNPRNGIATLNVGMFDGKSIYEIRKTYPASEFTASHTKPNVTLGDSSILAIDPDTLLVTGISSNRENQITWNLTFIRTAPPYDFIQMPGESHYLSYIPGAWVSGDIELNGISYSMNNSYGHYDHNWGHDLFSPVQWTWATVCKPEDTFALTMQKVEHFTWHTYASYVTYGNGTIYFENIKTDFDEYTYEIKPPIPFFTYYPKKMQVRAENHEGYVLEFEVTVLKNLPILLILPRVLNEQVSLFQGTLSKDGTLLYTFEIVGFTEYSTLFFIL